MSKLTLDDSRYPLSVQTSIKGESEESISTSIRVTKTYHQKSPIQLHRLVSVGDKRYVIPSCNYFLNVGQTCTVNKLWKGEQMGSHSHCVLLELHRYISWLIDEIVKTKKQLSAMLMLMLHCLSTRGHFVTSLLGAPKNKLI